MTPPGWPPPSGRSSIHQAHADASRTPPGARVRTGRRGHPDWADLAMLETEVAAAAIAAAGQGQDQDFGICLREEDGRVMAGIAATFWPEFDS